MAYNTGRENKNQLNKSCLIVVNIVKIKKPDNTKIKNMYLYNTNI